MVKQKNEATSVSGFIDSTEVIDGELDLMSIHEIKKEYIRLKKDKL